MEHSASGEKEGEAEIRTRFETYRARFIEAMDDDLNTADALAALFELAREINTVLTAANEPSRELCEFALSLFGELADVLGLLYQKKEASLDEEIEALIAQRAEARKNRDWAPPTASATSSRPGISCWRIPPRALNGAWRSKKEQSA